MSLRHSTHASLLLAALCAASAAQADDFAEKLRLATEQAAHSSPPAATAEPAAAAGPAAAKPKAKAKAAQPAKAEQLPVTTELPAATASATPIPTPDLAARVAKLESAFDRVKFEVFGHLRYDSQDNKAGAISDPRTGAPLMAQAASHVRGLYARRVEAKLTASLRPSANAVVGYDFAEGKLKDLGLEWSGLPLWPGRDDLAWTLKVGQFRQAFGIEPQTGSTKVWWAERAMMYGGAQPFTANVKLMGERAMGLHALHQQELGWAKLSVGLSAANDLSEDQAAGKNKISPSDGFPKQTLDEGPSFTGRVGLDSHLGALKAGLGLSLARDSQNASFLAAKPSDLKYEELLGLDLSLEWPKVWKLQAEWVGANAIRGDLGLSTRREGWSAQQSLQPLRCFSAEAPQVELLARYESVMPDVHQGLPWGRTLQAASAGLKWAYGDGKQALLLQCTAYSVDQDFGAAAGTELWVLQQQLQF